MPPVWQIYYSCQLNMGILYSYEADIVFKIILPNHLARMYVKTDYKCCYGTFYLQCIILPVMWTNPDDLRKWSFYLLSVAGPCICYPDSEWSADYVGAVEEMFLTSC